MSNDKLRTLGDLAKLSGVSIATVSRALHDSPAVNDATKRHIWQLAHEHEFPLHRYALSHSLSAEATIAVVVPRPQGRAAKLSDPFVMELMAGIGDAARERNCDFVVSHRAPADYEDLSELIANDRADGIIFLGQSTLHEHYNRLADRQKRFVVWGGELPGQNYCSVGSDNHAGGRRATRHLIRLGRRRIVFLGDIEAPEAAQRFEGYKQALEEANIAFDPALHIPAHFEIEASESVVDGLVHSDIRFDGIVAASDLIALGAVRALQRDGLRVPDDVSVIGYDDVAFARFATPALTTIAQDTARAGRLLVSKLLGGKNLSAPLSERLETSLIVRQSCGG